MSETKIMTIYGFEIPKESIMVGFRGIDHGTVIDIPHDRRVSRNTGIENDNNSRISEFLSWTNDEYKTHVTTNFKNMDYDKEFEHSFGGDCKAKWRRGGGYLYFIAWRPMHDDSFAEPKYLYWEIHPKFSMSDVGYGCSYCNKALPPENKAYTVSDDKTDKYGYVCEACHNILTLKEFVEERITELRKE